MLRLIFNFLLTIKYRIFIYSPENSDLIFVKPLIKKTDLVGKLAVINPLSNHYKAMSKSSWVQNFQSPITIYSWENEQ